MKNDSTRIELIEPIDSDSPFYSLLKKYKNCFYHICYETHNISEDISFLRSKGFVQTTKISSAPALENRNVVFLLNPKIGLVELLEIKSDEGIRVSL